MSNASIVDTFQEWSEWFNKEKPTETSIPGRVLDSDAVRYLAQSKAVVGFMTCPLPVYDNQRLEAKSRSCTDLKSFKRWFDSSTNRIFLYEVMHIPPVCLFRTMDPLTFKVIDILDGDGNLTYAEMPSQWVIRYGVIGEELYEPVA